MYLLWRKVSVKNHKIWFCKHYMKNKPSSKEGSLKVEHSRAKRKSVTETVAPRNVFSVERKKGISQKCQRTVSEITYSRGIPNKFSESKCAVC